MNGWQKTLRWLGIARREQFEEMELMLFHTREMIVSQEIVLADLRKEHRLLKAQIRTLAAATPGGHNALMKRHAHAIQATATAEDLAAGNQGKEAP